jgi:hypothetical protein
LGGFGFGFGLGFGAAFGLVGRKKKLRVLLSARTLECVIQFVV